MTTSRTHRLLVLVTVALTSLAVLYMLWRRLTDLHMGFLYDEMYTLATANPENSLSFIWREILLKDINPPLYNLMLYAWNHLAQPSGWWMRVFSLLAGIATLLISCLGTPADWPRLKKMTLFALTATANALAISAFYIRSYAWAILTVYIFTLAALRIARHMAQRQFPSKKLWTAFFLAGLAGSYIHFFAAGLFFITALILFIYACCYKTARKTVFWGTAAAFALWTPWLAVTYHIMAAPTGMWWYVLPWAQASWEILQYLLGSPAVIAWILMLGILALVSIVHIYRGKVAAQIDFMLPLGQLLLLTGVVALISLKYNLWMDRYFSVALPCILLLLTELMYHLYQRHRLFVVLLAALPLAWAWQYIPQNFNYVREYEGLKNAFAFVINELKADTVVVDMDKTGYTEAAFNGMMSYYVPPEASLKILRLTPQTAARAAQEPKLPLLIPLCTQMHMLETTLAYRIEEDQPPFIFDNDICLITIHPVPEP